MRQEIVINTPVDEQAATEFARVLWGNSAGKGDVVFTLLRNRHNRERLQYGVDFHLENDISNIQEHVDAGWDVFVTPCRFSSDRADGPNSRKAADVCVVPGVWADLDVKSSDHLPNTKEELDSVLTKLLKPTILVDSGSGGVHAYWLYNEPFTDTQEARRVSDLWIIELSRRAKEILGRDIKFDPVSDLARVLRLPGTYRFPKPPFDIYTPKLVKLKHSNGPRYTIEAIRSYIAPEIYESYKKNKYKAVAGKFIKGKKVSEKKLRRKAEKELAQLVSRLSGTTTERNNELNATAYFAGQWGAHKVLSEEESRDALLSACNENGLIADDGEGACIATFDSGWNSGLKNPKEITEDLLNEQEEAIKASPGDHPEISKYSEKMLSYELGTEIIHPTIRFYREEWRKWRRDGSWRVVTDDQVDQLSLRNLHGKWLVFLNDKGEEDRKRIIVNLNFKREQRSALKSRLLLDPELEMPCWIDDAIDLRELPDPSKLIVLRNGMLYYPSRYLTAHDPRLFTSVSLPFEYDETANCPDWKKFLKSVFPDDPGAINLLQEMFGYFIAGRTDIQKVFVLKGRPRTGKSTIGKILEALIGSNNVAGLRLEDLSKNFALEALIGKKLNICTEARISGKTSGVVQKLLSISGGDSQTIDRKFKSRLHVNLPINFLVISNEFPSLDDASGAIASRFVPIEIRVDGWLGKEDLTLYDRLATELPGIFNWALDGLDKMKNKNSFTLPSSSKAALDIISDSTSSVDRFIEECCVVGEDKLVSIKEIHQTWNRWMQINSQNRTTQATMVNKLNAQLPSLNKKRIRLKDGSQPWVLTGIDLNEKEKMRI